MPLAPGHKHNFETLRQAVLNGDAALLDCTTVNEGKSVAVVCAANRQPDRSVEFVPVAMLFNDNPYETILPPEATGPGG